MAVSLKFLRLIRVARFILIKGYDARGFIFETEIFEEPCLFCSLLIFNNYSCVFEGQRECIFIRVDFYQRHTERRELIFFTDELQNEGPALMIITLYFLLRSRRKSLMQKLGIILNQIAVYLYQNSMQQGWSWHSEPDESALLRLQSIYPFGEYCKRFGTDALRIFSSEFQLKSLFEADFTTLNLAEFVVILLQGQAEYTIVASISKELSRLRKKKQIPIQCDSPCLLNQIIQELVELRAITKLHFLLIPSQTFYSRCFTFCFSHQDDKLSHQLLKYKLFSRPSLRRLKTFIHKAKAIRMKKNQTIFVQGRTCNAVYLVVRGLVEKTTQSHSVYVVQGEIMGLRQVLQKQKYDSSAVAKIDPTYLLVWTYAQLAQLFDLNSGYVDVNGLIKTLPAKVKYLQFQSRQQSPLQKFQQILRKKATDNQFMAMVQPRATFKNIKPIHPSPKRESNFQTVLYNKTIQAVKNIKRNNESTVTLDTIEQQVRLKASTKKLRTTSRVQLKLKRHWPSTESRRQANIRRMEKNSSMPNYKKKKLEIT